MRSLACPDCGRRPEPWEVDHRRQARVKAVQNALRLLDIPPASASPGDAPSSVPSGVLREVPGWLDDFLAAARCVAKGSPGCEDLLAESVVSLTRLRDHTAGAIRRRPQLAQVDLACQAVDSMEQILRTLLEALSSPSPLAAQTCAVAAQRRLDVLAELTEEAAWMSRTALKFDGAESVEDVVNVLFAQGFEFYGASDLYGLNAAGLEELEGVLGARAPGASGLMFALHGVFARTMFDRRRFNDLVGQAHALLTAHADGVLALVADSVFEDDLRAGLLEVFDSCTQISMVLRQSHIPRHAGRALLDVAASLLEGPGRVLASMIMLASGRKSRPYAKLRHDDATAIVRAAQQDPELADLFQGLDCDLRNAQAHASARYEDDRLVMDLRSTSRAIPWDEVLDGTLQAQEALLAWQVALTAMLAGHGISGYGTLDLHQLCGFAGQRRMIAILLEGMGCRDVLVTPGPSHWQIDAGTAARSGPIFLGGLVTAMLRFLPGTADTLSLTVRLPDGPHSLGGPLEPWRDFTSHPSDSNEYVTGMIRASLMWTHNGKPYLPGDVLRRWAAQQALEAADRPLPARVRRMRELKALAAVAEDAPLHGALAAAIRAVRLGQPDKADQVFFDNLKTWRNTPVQLDLR
ncbi:hypothetical protein GCM10018781_64620 [Kitasatospora indigofera]|uniref:Uncharacterized protein n=1 Tax=Kitasatospora indigofera TaxID=67307 RepID=A0A919GB89_9ACTN|nr:hypothetical protein GCM10018781_64620 [Kitasatospora indigofera]